MLRSVLFRLSRQINRAQRLARWKGHENTFRKYHIRAIDIRSVHFSFDAASHEEFMPHGGIPIRSRISLKIVGFVTLTCAIKVEVQRCH